MRKQKQVQINGDTYLLEQFGARQGFKLGKKVAKLALPTIGALYGTEDEFSLSVAAEVVAEHLDELDDQTIQELLSSATKNKYAIDFDNEFAGNYMTLFKLLWEIIQFNFSDILFQMAPGVTEAE